MWIIGISCFYHDSAAALPRDGEVVAAEQEKHFTRRTYAPGFPSNAVCYCLQEDGIRTDQLDLVVFYEKPEEQNLFGIAKLNVSRSNLPAITHVDYTARIQTVTRDDNALYYDMIEEFRWRTGGALVINTSFNVRGELIVCSTEDPHEYSCDQKWITW